MGGALPNALVGLLYYKDRAVVYPPCKWPQEMAFAVEGPPGDGVDWGGHAHSGEVTPQNIPRHPTVAERPVSLST